MRKDIQINVNSETNQVLRSNEILGISTENLQGKIIFKPEPFVDGACRMYIENKGSILMDKEEDCYTLDIKSSLLITPGIDICFKITEAENEDGIPIFCTQKMYFKVLDTIDNSGEPPEEYPTWVEILDSKIAELNELEQSIEAGEEERNRKVDEAIENIEDLTEAYNQNAVEKTNEFNTNATNKTTAFDNHVSSKEDEFDTDTDTIVSTKKAELDDYETAKENELDTHANILKNDLDDYESAKETELNSYTSTKKTELDTYTNEKKTELDTHEESLEGALDSEASDLISAFNTNATEKTNNFNTNATNKTSDFNDNATQKTTDFNDNATEKTTEYDTNATEKVDEYNANAEDKIAEYDAHVAELQTELDELKETVDSELETATVEGTSIDVSDSAEYRGRMEVKGNTYQKQLSGKNLFDKDNPIEKRGSINDNNIFRGGGGNYCIVIPCKPNTTYTAQKRNDGDTNRLALASCETNPSDTADVATPLLNNVRNDSAGNLSITTGSTANYIIMQYYRNVESTLTKQQILDSIQIEEGSTATDYEPYCGGPSPNPNYPQEIKVVTGDNVVKHIGKNLFDKENAKVLKAYIHSSGVITKHSMSRLTYVEVQPNTTYTISKLSNGFCECAFFDEEPAIGLAGGYGFVNAPFDKRVAYDGVTKAKYTFTTRETTKYFAFRMFRTDVDSSGGGTVANLQAMLDSIQLEQGSTATDYEEYKGKEFELNLWTENKFDKNGNIKNNYYLDANGGKVENTGAWFTEYYIEVKPNTLYLMQGGQNFKRICYYDKDKEFISRDNSEIDSLKVITPTNCAYVRLSNNGEYDSLEFKECIELCKIDDHEDVLFKNERSSEYYNSSLVENAWYKYQAINHVFATGGTAESWEWQKRNEQKAMAQTSRLTDCIDGRTRLSIYSNFFVPSTGNNVYSTGNDLTNIIGCAENNKIRISLDPAAFPDLASFKSFLEENPLEVICIAGNPKYIQITDETLIAQLEALHKFRTEQGVIHIWTEAEELEPNLEFTYKRSNNLRLQALEQAVVALGGV